MIENYTHFKPKIELRTKYITYLLALSLLVLIVISMMFGVFYLAMDRSFSDFMEKIIIQTIIRLVVINAIAVPFAIYYYRAISFEIVEDEVHVNRGIITKTRKIVPYRTITNIEIKRGPFDRVFGIGTIELQTAGFSSNKMGPEERLDGLPSEQLDDIQHLLISNVRKVVGSPGTSHDVDKPQTNDTTLSDMLVEIKQLKSILLDIKNKE
ncbi:MAG: PH domain-containing protein [Candidatus Kariarchaeaceae archaeon]